MAISRLIEHVSPEVIFHRRPLSDEQNAWFPWHDAKNLAWMPDIHTTDHDLLMRLRWGDPGDDPTDPKPVDIETDQERACVADLIERNKRVLELMDEGIHRGAFRFPDDAFEATTSGDKSLIEADDVIMWIMGEKVCNSLYFRLKLDRAKNDFTAMVNHLVNLLHMGKIIAASDSQVVHFIIAHGFHIKALSEIRRLAQEGSLSKKATADLIEFIEQYAPTPEDLVRCIGIDFCHYTLNRLDLMPDGADSKSLVDELLRHYYSDISLMPPLCKTEDYEDFVSEEEDAEVTADLEKRVQWRRQALHDLLDDHPCPFDKKATARLMGARMLDWINSIRQADVDSLEFADLVVSEIWPRQLHPEFPIDYLGDSPLVRRNRAKCLELCDLCEQTLEQELPLPPTEDEINNARKQLLAIDNPIGRLLTESLDERLSASVLQQWHEQIEETLDLLRRNQETS
ncbi:MAG: hypothetical protein JW719_12725 [Pirellulales bacterium]|nr:hypothetical protein [Pirellulales bacterium]